MIRVHRSSFLHPILFVLIFTACSVRAAEAASNAKSGFFLKPGDTVVFMGDSITALHRATWPRGDHSPNYNYCMDIVSWTSSHFASVAPGGSAIKFYDLGVAGDTTHGDQWPNGGPVKDDCVPPSTAYSKSRTIDSDLAYIEKLNPTVVTLDFGMNDGEYVECDPAHSPSNTVLFNAFTSGVKHIVESLRDWSSTNGKPLRIVVLTPGYFDNQQRASAGWKFWWGAPAANYNQTLQAFGSWELGYVHGLHDRNVTCIDLNGPMVLTTKRLNHGQSLTQEGIHPTEQGYEVMASTILHAWDADEAGAYSVSLKPGAAVKWINGWQPWPLENGSTASGIYDDVNSDQAFTLFGRNTMPRRSYTLMLNGVKAGVYSGATLKAGVNLAGNPALAKLFLKSENAAMDTFWNEFNVAEQTLVPMNGQGNATSFGWVGDPIVCTNQPAGTTNAFSLQLIPRH